MLLIAIAIFLVGSIACALAPTHVGADRRARRPGARRRRADLARPDDRRRRHPAARARRYQAYFAAVFVTVERRRAGARRLLRRASALVGRSSGSTCRSARSPICMTNRVLRRLPRHERPHRIDVTRRGADGGGDGRAAAGADLGRHAPIPGRRRRSLGFSPLSAVAWVLFALRLARAPEPFVPLDRACQPGRRAARSPDLSSSSARWSACRSTCRSISRRWSASARGQSGLALIALMGGTVDGRATYRAAIMAWSPHYKLADRRRDRR